MENSFSREIGMPRYLMTSEELLDPKVGAIEIGELKSNQYEEVLRGMDEEAEKANILNPLMVVDLIFKEEKLSELGSSGQPYPVADFEWEQFVLDLPEYCGDMVPKVYMVDGDIYSCQI